MQWILSEGYSLANSSFYGPFETLSLAQAALEQIPLSFRHNWLIHSLLPLRREL